MRGLITDRALPFLMALVVVAGCQSTRAPSDRATAALESKTTTQVEPPDREAPAPSALSPSPSYPPAPGEFTVGDWLTDIHFDFDSYEVRPDDRRMLDQTATWLRTNPNALVLIEGHTDQRGTGEYNLALGDRRATAALGYLIAQGVPAARMVAISYGKERPVCGEPDETCWAQNRRAHFLVKPL